MKRVIQYFQYYFCYRRKKNEIYFYKIIRSLICELFIIEYLSVIFKIRLKNSFLKGFMKDVIQYFVFIIFFVTEKRKMKFIFIH